MIRTTISRNQNVAIRATIDDSDESRCSFDLSYTALVLDLVPGVDEGSHEKRAKSRTRELVEKVILKNDKQRKTKASCLASRLILTTQLCTGLAKRSIMESITHVHYIRPSLKKIQSLNLLSAANANVQIIQFGKLTP
jgi:hypothetical protein